MSDSLHDIMNAVSASLDRVDPADIPAAMDEFQAFLLIDPVLASLNKQYCDARATRIKAQKEFGARDAMTDMAVLYEDSAWCAVQTRLMELRACRTRRRKAQDMIADSMARAGREKRDAAAKIAAHCTILSQTRASRGGQDILLWLLLYLLLCGQGGAMRLYMPSYTFNRLAA